MVLLELFPCEPTLSTANPDVPIAIIVNSLGKRPYLYDNDILVFVVIVKAYAVNTGGSYTIPPFYRHGICNGTQVLVLVSII